MRSTANNINTIKHSILNRKILSVFLTLIFIPHQFVKSLFRYFCSSRSKSFSRNYASSFIGVGFIALLFVLSPVNLAFANEPSPVAPTLVSIAEGAELTNPKPTITGLTFNNTQVDIFIDNQFSGQAVVRNHESGTADFYYHSPLLSAGEHVVHAIARSGANVSEETTRINFRIIGTAAPTLFIPVFNLQTTEFKPFIVGLVHNNSRVKIYIDDEYNGEIWVKNHPSGVANFAYKPKYDLTVGMHRVNAIAVNNITGQESKISSMASFEVKQPYPAPTLFRPTAKDATWFRPNINGLAKNGSHVEVYINDIKHRVDLQDNLLGSTSFTFRPEQNLRAGINVIFTVAFSKTGKMSRKSNIIYWDLTPKEAKEIESLGEVSDTTTEEPSIEIDLEDRSAEAQVTIEEEGIAEPPVVDQAEPPVASHAEPVVSGEADVSSELDETSKDTETDDDELEDSTNWSKIVGLVILAVLIITLIVQLLKKEDPEDKQGETLSLFEDGKKEKDGTSPKASAKGDDKKEKPKTDKPDKDKKSDDIIPPPPPPSSNLPF